MNNYSNERGVRNNNIANMSAILAGLGMKIEIASWRNIVPNVWSQQFERAATAFGPGSARAFGRLQAEGL